jgi:hypothetical protein
VRYRAVDFGAAEWLSLAAAPAFAVMALLSGLSGSGAMDAICTAAHGGSVLDGMVPMYALMGALHLGPWLRLVSAGERAQSAAGTE